MRRALRFLWALTWTASLCVGAIVASFTVIAGLFELVGGDAVIIGLLSVIALLLLGVLAMWIHGAWVRSAK